MGLQHNTVGQGPRTIGLLRSRFVPTKTRILRADGTIHLLGQDATVINHLPNRTAVYICFKAHWHKRAPSLISAVWGSHPPSSGYNHDRPSVPFLVNGNDVKRQSEFDSGEYGFVLRMIGVVI